MAPSTLAQWFGAAGTIGAVFLALFKDVFRIWWRRPVLSATCSKETPFTSRTPIMVATPGSSAVWSGDCYYIRVQIANIGKTRAEKVQMYASKLAKKGADQKFTDVPTFLPLNAKWSNSPTGQSSAVLDGISPKMAAFADLVALSHPSNPYQAKPAGTPDGVVIAELQLEVAPFSGSNLLSPGTYQLTLRIAAANVDPIEKILEFTHTGNWIENDAEMRRDGFGISLM
jgi:hypothetical protein